jgi:hypothetical protein
VNGGVHQTEIRRERDDCDTSSKNGKWGITDDRAEVNQTDDCSHTVSYCQMCRHALNPEGHRTPMFMAIQLTCTDR